MVFQSLTKTCIFDLETSSLHADTAIVLCAVMCEYGDSKNKTVIRADDFKGWKTNRSNNRPIVREIISCLDDYDIFVAHNGQYFDKRMLVSYALKYHLPVALRFEKFIDPVLLARRHMRLARNNLQKLIDWLDIPDSKTDIKWDHWMKASYEGSRKSMDYIVGHCVADVTALHAVYDEMRKLVKNVDDRGSSF